MSLTLVVLLIQGCTVGPNFSLPSAHYPERYTLHPTPHVISNESNQSSESIWVGRSVAAKWWSLFHSPHLNQVVEQALHSNKTLAAARDTLAAARENLIAIRGGTLPQIDVNAGAQRSQNSRMQSNGNTSVSEPNVGNLYTFGATVSYAVDAFGANRRLIEQQQALVNFQAYELAAAYLTLTGACVSETISIASLREQLHAVAKIVADDERNLLLTKEKYQAGKAALTDVLIAQSQLDNDLTLRPALEQQLSTAQHALSILSGHNPSEWTSPSLTLNNLKLPSELPLSLPSALVRQRPDILAAQARLHADSAAIGIATANLYPNLTLSAAVGQQSPDSGTLFDAVNRFWSFAAGLTAPLFHAGALQAQRKAAIDTYQASLNNYKETVLAAFEQVADSLQALEHDANLVILQGYLLETAQKSLSLQQASYAYGKTDVLQLISAQRTYQQARLGFITAKAQRLQDTANLLLALGGGWWQDTKLDMPALTRPRGKTRPLK